MNEFYRVVLDRNDGTDWRDTGYGPYSTLYVARNVASQMYGGNWKGSNSQTIKRSRFDYATRTSIQYDELIKIQKLTPVLKPFREGLAALILAMEWTDVDAG